MIQYSPACVDPSYPSHHASPIFSIVISGLGLLIITFVLFQAVETVFTLKT